MQTKKPLCRSEELFLDDEIRRLYFTLEKLEDVRLQEKTAVFVFFEIFRYVKHQLCVKVGVRSDVLECGQCFFGSDQFDCPQIVHRL